MSDYNEEMRRRIAVLLGFSIQRKHLAEKMGIQPSAFTRWWKRQTKNEALSVSALEGLDRFEDEIRAALGDKKETQRVPRTSGAAAGNEFQKR